MSDNTWELWLGLTCALILLAWAASAWARWYITRHARRMQHFERLGWDSMQDAKHRIARRGACERAGLRP